MEVAINLLFCLKLGFFQKYAVTISKQISVKGLQKSAVIGQGLEEKDLEGFSGEQIAQLYELYQETSKPSEYPS